MDKDSPSRLFGVVIVVSLVCSLLVASATILLREKQQLGKQLERKRNVLVAAGIASPRMSEAEIEAGFARVRPVIVDFTTGKIDTTVDAARYDMQRAAKDPDTSIAIDPAKDTALLHRMPRYGVMYLLAGEKGVQALVLPISGLGLWSTIYGYISLQNDGKTVSGLTFYQHGETPGLGGEIDNPAWRKQWLGKIALGTAGEPVMQVMRGKVPAGSAGSEHQVDGISGATITSRAVGNMVNFWLGDTAYGKFIPLVLQGGIP